MTPLAISYYSVTTALGAGCSANWDALHQLRSGLTPCDFPEDPAVPLSTWIGKVAGINDVRFEKSLAHFFCRNHALTLLALEQDGFLAVAQRVVARYGAPRVGIFLGTSTSGIRQTELAYMARENDNAMLPDWFNYTATHNIYATTEFVRHVLGITGPAMTISTACSSSAKVFASAARAIEQGYCDAAIVGGTDSLCLTTLYGFNSLQLLSSQPCRPSDAMRDGISIGEASGFAILERNHVDTNIALSGYGESNDAFHMSQPHPQGAGAHLAMHNALLRANIEPIDVDYINLHGTGTRANDQSEANAVISLFGTNTTCSSTKGWSGHTLGAAGIVDAVFSMLMMENNTILPSLNTLTVDPDIQINIARHIAMRPVQYVLSNSFGFGGNNCSLVFTKR